MKQLRKLGSKGPSVGAVGYGAMSEAVQGARFDFWDSAMLLPIRFAVPTASIPLNIHVGRSRIRGWADPGVMTAMDRC